MGSELLQIISDHKRTTPELTYNWTESTYSNWSRYGFGPHQSVTVVFRPVETSQINPDQTLQVCTNEFWVEMRSLQYELDRLLTQDKLGYKKKKKINIRFLKEW